MGRMGKDYSKARKKWSIEPRLFGAWMGLARAYCLTSGDDKLTLKRWGKVLELEHERLERLRRCEEENLSVRENFFHSCGWLKHPASRSCELRWWLCGRAPHGR